MEFPCEFGSKLYLYGYQKNIRSSRRLEGCCHINIEAMWLGHRGGLFWTQDGLSDTRGTVSFVSFDTKETVPLVSERPSPLCQISRYYILSKT
jgi:hypothetical protein